MNTLNNGTLFLFTAQYPYGTGETFIETELEVLAARFSGILIFPLHAKGEARMIPENASIVNWTADYHYNGRATLLKNIPLFLKIILQEKNIGQRFGVTRSLLLQNIARAEAVKKHIPKLQSGNAVFYSYWFDDWATILGILKAKGEIKSFVSRAHGFDLYDERRNDGIIPLRNFQMKTVSAVFPVSRFGKEYLTKKIPNAANKIQLSYLGVVDRGVNPFQKEEGLTIVSCSNLIPLKRIHLLIAILSNVKINIRWIHFGDGPLRAELEEQAKALPANIAVTFKGQTANDAIIRFYKEHTVNLFINTSETEGIPVTIQEATSFGIPVIAPNVGGIPEIVNNKTGTLIPADFNVMEVAELINRFENSPMNTAEFRAGCREFWKHTFDANTNYPLFFKQLTKDRT